MTFSATNLFVGPPGLALEISDLGGKELKQLYADPYINFSVNTAIISPGDITFIIGLNLLLPVLAVAKGN